MSDGEVPAPAPRKRRRVAPDPEVANSIAPAPPRQRALKLGPPAAEPPQQGAEKRPDNPRQLRAEREAEIPEAVRKKFVQIRRDYFFPDGARAFSDRGRRLTTSSENTEVIRSLVQIAEARGWQEIVVRGTERFRREAWAAGQAAGLKVRGYEPTEFERGRAVRAMAGRSGEARSDVPRNERETRAPASARSEESGRTTRLLAGRLVEHGAAPYRHDAKEAMSYYVTVETARGDRTIWGVDLERAFRESQSRPKIGEEVGIRSFRTEPVTVKTEQRDGEGRVVGHRDLAAHRNRWVVEKKEFLEGRAEAARTLADASIDAKKGTARHPELAGSYLQIRAAELAAQQIRDGEDRRQFVAKVREALATSVARGEPLPPVRLKERAPEVRSRMSRTPETAQARA